MLFLATVSSCEGALCPLPALTAGQGPGLPIVSCSDPIEGMKPESARMACGLMHLAAELKQDPYTFASFRLFHGRRALLPARSLWERQLYNIANYGAMMAPFDDLVKQACF